MTKRKQSASKKQANITTLFEQQFNALLAMPQSQPADQAIDRFVNFIKSKGWNLFKYPLNKEGKPFVVQIIEAKQPYLLQKLIDKGVLERQALLPYVAAYSDSRLLSTVLFNQIIGFENFALYSEECLFAGYAFSQMEHFAQDIDPNVSQDEAGNTALHIAVEKDYIKNLLFLLLLPTINPTIKNNAGETALHQAFRQRNFFAMFLLLNDSNTSLQTENEQQQKPCDLYPHKNNMRTKQLLEVLEKMHLSYCAIKKQFYGYVNAQQIGLQCDIPISSFTKTLQDIHNVVKKLLPKGMEKKEVNLFWIIISLIIQSANLILYMTCNSGSMPDSNYKEAALNSVKDYLRIILAAIFQICMDNQEECIFSLSGYLILNLIDVKYELNLLGIPPEEYISYKIKTAFMVLAKVETLNNHSLRVEIQNKSLKVFLTILQKELQNKENLQELKLSKESLAIIAGIGEILTKGNQTELSGQSNIKLLSNFKDFFDYEALYEACGKLFAHYGDKPQAEICFAKAKNLNTFSPGDRYVDAAQSSSGGAKSSKKHFPVEMIRELLQIKNLDKFEAFINQNMLPRTWQDGDGKTLLHYAIELGSLPALSILIYGQNILTNINLATEDYLWLHYALSSIANINGFRMEFNVQDKDGCAPAHFAANQQSAEYLAYLLLPGGVNLNVQDSLGKTAAHIIFETGNIEKIYTLLNSMEPGLDIRDSKGKLPIDYYPMQDEISTCLLHYLYGFHALLYTVMNFSPKNGVSLEDFIIQKEELKSNLEFFLESVSHIKEEHKRYLAHPLYLSVLKIIAIIAQKLPNIGFNLEKQIPECFPDLQGLGKEIVMEDIKDDIQNFIATSSKILDIIYSCTDGLSLEKPENVSVVIEICFANLRFHVLSSEGRAVNKFIKRLNMSRTILELLEKLQHSWFALRTGELLKKVWDDEILYIKPQELKNKEAVNLYLYIIKRTEKIERTIMASKQNFSQLSLPCQNYHRLYHFVGECFFGLGEMQRAAQCYSRVLREKTKDWDEKGAPEKWLQEINEQVKEKFQKCLKVLCLNLNNGLPIGINSRWSLQGAAVRIQLAPYLQPSVIKYLSHHQIKYQFCDGALVVEDIFNKKIEFIKQSIQNACHDEPRYWAESIIGLSINSCPLLASGQYFKKKKGIGIRIEDNPYKLKEIIEEHYHVECVFNEQENYLIIPTIKQIIQKSIPIEPENNNIENFINFFIQAHQQAKMFLPSTKKTVEKFETPIPFISTEKEINESSPQRKRLNKKSEKTRVSKEKALSSKAIVSAPKKEANSLNKKEREQIEWMWLQNNLGTNIYKKLEILFQEDSRLKMKEGVVKKPGEIKKRREEVAKQIEKIISFQARGPLMLEEQEKKSDARQAEGSVIDEVDLTQSNLVAPELSPQEFLVAASAEQLMSEQVKTAQEIDDADLMEQQVPVLEPVDFRDDIVGPNMNVYEDEPEESFKIVQERIVEETKEDRIQIKVDANKENECSYSDTFFSSGFFFGGPQGPSSLMSKPFTGKKGALNAFSLWEGPVIAGDFFSKDIRQIGYKPKHF